MFQAYKLNKTDKKEFSTSTSRLKLHVNIGDDYIEQNLQNKNASQMLDNINYFIVHVRSFQYIFLFT